MVLITYCVMKLTAASKPLIRVSGAHAETLMPYVRWQSNEPALFSSKKFCKIFQIPHNIKSLDVCMEY